VENLITLRNPTAPRSDFAAHSYRTIGTLQGAVVGFIDNAKPNFSHLVDDLATLLVEQYGVTKVLKRKKRAPNIPGSQAVIEELARECDLVITGSGD
jgi:hypothetical protein